jgi:hypothetical protein
MLHRIRVDDEVMNTGARRTGPGARAHLVEHRSASLEATNERPTGRTAISLRRHIAHLSPESANADRPPRSGHRAKRAQRGAAEPLPPKAACAQPAPPAQPALPRSGPSRLASPYPTD